MAAQTPSDRSSAMVKDARSDQWLGEDIPTPLCAQGSVRHKRRARGDPTHRQSTNCPAGCSRLLPRPEHAEQRLTWLTKVLRLAECEVIEYISDCAPAIPTPPTSPPVTTASEAGRARPAPWKNCEGSRLRPTWRARRTNRA